MVALVFCRLVQLAGFVGRTASLAIFRFVSLACGFLLCLDARLGGWQGRRYRNFLCQFVLQGNADAIERDAVNEIRSPVQRVHNPVVSSPFLLFRPFFGNEPRFGQDFLQAFHQHFFGRFVHVGHIVVAAFDFHVLAADFFCLLADKSGYGFAQGEYLLGHLFQIQCGLVGHSAKFFKKLDLFGRGLFLRVFRFAGFPWLAGIRSSACVRYAGRSAFVSDSVRPRNSCPKRMQK